jgi:hypothetical protein
MRKRPEKDSPPKLKRKLPYAFVLEELAHLQPNTRPMFGCTAIYLGDKIVFILREREAHADDNGVWIATTSEHHASLQKDFPSMRSIRLFGTDGPSGWQNLPADCDDFEESVLKACALVEKGDPRIGKIPKGRKKKPAKSPVQASQKGPDARRRPRKPT